MSEQRGERDQSGADVDPKAVFGLHAFAYALGAGLLVLVDLAFTEGWWFFWPVMAWGLVVLVHYLYLKSVHVDSRWVEERADRVLDKAYDLGHIEDIRQRYKNKNPAARNNRRVED